MKVLEGNIQTLLAQNLTELREMENELSIDDASDDASDELSETYRCILRRPIVKKDVQDEAQRRCEKPTLDISLPHVSCGL